MTAKELKGIRYLDYEIDGLLKAMEIERSRAERMTASLVPDKISGGDPPSREDTYTRILDLSREVDSRVDQLVSMKQTAASIIEQIPNALHRSILTLRYLSGAKWEDIAAQYNYSLRSIQRHHGRALQEFEKKR